MDGLEIFFTSLMVLMSVLILWFTGLVIYKLYKGRP